MLLALAAATTLLWSQPVTFAAVRAPNTGVQLATNAQGDALAVWTSRTQRVRATLIRANGTRTTRTLPGALTDDLVVVLDSRAVATAAWTRRGRLYTASATPHNRWSQPRRVARSGAVMPTLAVARDRRVLLVWTTGTRTGVAWRSPARRFEHAQILRRPAPVLIPGEGLSSRNGAAFDPRGRAYVWTTCDGVVGITRPHARTLRRVPLTSGPAAMSLSVGRTGLASWVPTRCTTDAAAGTPPGILHANVLRDGRFGPPTILTGPDGQPLKTSGSTAFAPGLVAAWADSGLLQVALVDGRQTAVVRDDRMPLAADAAGNVLLSTPYIGVTVRRPDGTEDPLVPGTLGPTWAVSPFATGFGVLYDPDLTTGPDHRVTSPATRLSLTFWR
ncbi:MAG TPA: hypothetical protein VNS09_17710 [Solirubrobacter sp.]|nr:hypothetical protein [Solirubrobacter sp.]